MRLAQKLQQVSAQKIPQLLGKSPSFYDELVADDTPAMSMLRVTGPLPFYYEPATAIPTTDGMTFEVACVPLDTIYSTNLFVVGTGESEEVQSTFIFSASTTRFTVAAKRGGVGMSRYITASTTFMNRLLKFTGVQTSNVHYTLAVDGGTNALNFSSMYGGVIPDVMLKGILGGVSVSGDPLYTQGSILLHAIRIKDPQGVTVNEWVFDALSTTVQPTVGTVALNAIGDTAAVYDPTYMEVIGFRKSDTYWYAADSYGLPPIEDTL